MISRHDTEVEVFICQSVAAVVDNHPESGRSWLVGPPDLPVAQLCGYADYIMLAIGVWCVEGNFIDAVAVARLPDNRKAHSAFIGKYA